MKKLAALLLTLMLAHNAALATTPVALSNAPVIDDYQLSGNYTEDGLSFTLSGTIEWDEDSNADTRSVRLLGGRVALLTAPDEDSGYGISYDAESGDYILTSETKKRGFFGWGKSRSKTEFSVTFSAEVVSSNGWKSTSFRVLENPIRPITLTGLPQSARLEIPGASIPEWEGNAFRGNLPAHHGTTLRWKAEQREEAGKLFYSAEGLGVVTVEAGLIRQIQQTQIKVLQGDIQEMRFSLAGTGEIVRVEGQDILAWQVEGANDSRELTLKFNRAINEGTVVQIHSQAPLSVFPVTATPLRATPMDAIRYGGYLRVLTEGAVKLSVENASGLSQISPEAFPSDQRMRNYVPQTATGFAYRFSGGNYDLSLRADNIMPEVGASAVLVYHIGEDEISLNTELELAIREAPLRELTLDIPSGFAITGLQAPKMADYVTRPKEGDEAHSELLISFTEPISERQLIRLQLERNAPLPDTEWVLPSLRIPTAKTLRGHIGLSADLGLRLTAERTTGLSDIAGSLFPIRTEGLQLAYRLKQDNWDATLSVERLAQSIQAEGFHLFTISEGITYGSSLINYRITGAPVSELVVSLPESYSNIEYSGRDIRGWNTQDGKTTIELHTPASGTYTLLATFEIPFEASGDVLSASGAMPDRVEAEQGFVVIGSNQPINIGEQNVTTNLLKIEPNEVPVEYRLLVESPILASYQYARRPFEGDFSMKLYKQAQSVDQVIDYAVLETHIALTGEVVTTARYLLKNKGHSHFRVTLPENTNLWTAEAEGKKVTAVMDDTATLIPLPPQADPNAIVEVVLKMASQMPNAERIKLSSPHVAVPTLLTEWNVFATENNRLAYLSGNLRPENESRSRFTGRFPWGLGIAGCLMVALGSAAVARGSRTGKAWLTRRFFIHLTIGGVIIAGGILALIGAHENNHVRNELIGDTELTFISPVNTSGDAHAIELKNLTDTSSKPVNVLSPIAFAVVCFAVGLFLRSKTPGISRVLMALAWLVALGSSYFLLGGRFFFVVLGALPFVHYLLPLARQLVRMPFTLPANTAALVIAMLLFAGADEAHAEVLQRVASSPLRTGQAVSVEQSAIVHDDGFVTASATVVWDAKKDDVLPFLSASATLTDFKADSDDVVLLREGSVDTSFYEARADDEGTYTLSFSYQCELIKADTITIFTMPALSGLTNRLELEVPSDDLSFKGASIIQQHLLENTASDTTSASFILSPGGDPAISWVPRKRDASEEQSVFYAESNHLFVPMAGIVEGLHSVHIRPAQGQVESLNFAVPEAVTITDVLTQELLRWRFDPDTQELRVTFSKPRSQPFYLFVRSQVATSPLPYSQGVAPIRVLQAENEVGQIGLATTRDVQLIKDSTSGLSPINLEDYPRAMLQDFGSHVDGLTLKRAWRYTQGDVSVTLSADAVEPDVRINGRQVLSLAEDRIVLGANFDVSITRAGIFGLSFNMPAGLDVESISSPTMSHWTEQDLGESGRKITLHFASRTEGNTSISLSLTGAGLKDTEELDVPKLVFDEANKQSGEIIIVPEQGMRMHVGKREGLIQLDPKEVGVRQKGSLVFRLLQKDWALGMSLEKVDAWIQATVLQDMLIRDGMIEATANMNYSIENSGVKELHVSLPPKAVGVRFDGEFIKDFLPSENAEPGQWTIALNRRVLGNYTLRASYQLVPDSDMQTDIIRGVVANDTTLQRGFVSIRSQGRLRVSVAQTPDSLHISDWQSVPSSLKKDIDAVDVNYIYRVTDPNFELPVTVMRHDSASQLPARVHAVTLQTVLGEDSPGLTTALIELDPGDKRVLRVQLPAQSRFWFAFVNGESVWSWVDGESVLIPLSKNSIENAATKVEFFYMAPTARENGDLREPIAPAFDLPLEKINWQLYVPKHWEVSVLDSTLQYHEPSYWEIKKYSLGDYRQQESDRKTSKMKQAEALLTYGNRSLEKGEQARARRAVKAAYLQSTGDAALNEDARVQWQNVMTQQAAYGLANRLNTLNDTPNAFAANGYLEADSLDEVNFTDEQVAQVLNTYSADDNEAILRLSRRLIEQHTASISRPVGIRAALPTHGKELSFSRPMLIETMTPLKISFERTHKSTEADNRLTGIVAVLAVALLLVLLRRNEQKES